MGQGIDTGGEIRQQWFRDDVSHAANTCVDDEALLGILGTSRGQYRPPFTIPQLEARIEQRLGQGLFPEPRWKSILDALDPSEKKSILTDLSTVAFVRLWLWILQQPSVSNPTPTIEDYKRAEHDIILGVFQELVESVVLRFRTQSIQQQDVGVRAIRGWLRDALRDIYNMRPWETIPSALIRRTCGLNVLIQFLGVRWNVHRQWIEGTMLSHGSDRKCALVWEPTRTDDSPHMTLAHEEGKAVLLGSRGVMRLRRDCPQLLPQRVVSRDGRIGFTALLDVAIEPIAWSNMTGAHYCPMLFVGNDRGDVSVEVSLLLDHEARSRERIAVTVSGWAPSGVSSVTLRRTHVVRLPPPNNGDYHGDIVVLLEQHNRQLVIQLRANRQTVNHTLEGIRSDWMERLYESNRVLLGGRPSTPSPAFRGAAASTSTTITAAATTSSKVLGKRVAEGRTAIEWMSKRLRQSSWPPGVGFWLFHVEFVPLLLQDKEITMLSRRFRGEDPHEMAPSDRTDTTDIEDGQDEDEWSVASSSDD